MKRIALKGLLVAALAVVGVAAGHQSASALGGVGYFSGNYTCNRDAGMNRNCGLTTASYHDDVVPGRPGMATAVPDFGTNKFAYRDWVIGQFYHPDANRHHAARFIIGTMLGNRALSNDIAEFRRRFDNPALTMTRYYTATPSTLGNISYRGLNEHNVLDFFWDPYRDGSGGYVYVFSVGGGPPAYVLQQNCGNPVGLPRPGIPPYNPENWRVTPGAKVQPVVGMIPFGAVPTGRTLIGNVGQEFEWELFLRNEGPTGMVRGVSYIGNRDGYSDPAWHNNWGLGRFPAVKDESGRSGPGGYIFGSWFSGKAFTRYRIQDADVGRTLCQWMSAFPRAHDDRRWIDSSRACVHVPYNYSLTPFADASPSIVDSPTRTISVTSRIAKTGTWSRDTDWRIVRLVYAPGNNPLTNPTFRNPQRGGAGPCAFFASSSPVHCNENWQRYPNTVFRSGSETRTPTDSFGPDFRAGTRICYASVVSRPTHDANPVWGYSALSCVTAAKSPRVQIWGGDVRVGSSNSGLSGSTNPNAFIRTLHSSMPLGHKGSWSEYGLFAPSGGSQPSAGNIWSASGGALSGMDGAPNTANNAQLSFANTINPPGRFGEPMQVPELIDSLTARPETRVHNGAAFPINSVNGATEVVTLRQNDTRIRGTLQPSTTTLIIRSQGTVRIDDNLLLGNRPFTHVNQVPQIIIIARNIIIEPNVTQVDAWLVAQPVRSGGGLTGGAISTCGPIQSGRYYTGLYVTGECDAQRLIINGLVIARELQLRRTASEDLSGRVKESSEVINMRADAYLWAAGQVSATGRIDTIFTNELPPRF